MTYRRRTGRRASGRKKVTRAELVDFYQKAGRRERLKLAEMRAAALARWIKGAIIFVGAVAALLLAARWWT